MSTPFSRTSAQTNSIEVFYPLSTVRCVGPVLFRDQAARDIACLLDVDDDVVSWSCRTTTLTNASETYRPDFTVECTGRRFIIDADREERPPAWVNSKAASAGLPFEIVAPSTLPRIRLKNAKDLLRYARHDAALSDRIRLLAALDEYSSLSVSDALMVFRETKPVAGLASMVLQRFIAMDLDDRLIGPETIVRRRRD
jgi:hypothetical protein